MDAESQPDKLQSSRDLRLIEPSVDLEWSYASYLMEIMRQGEQPFPAVLSRTAESFSALVRTLQYSARGIDLPDGEVPHSTYWLVEGDSNELVGVSNLRHELTKEIARDRGHISFGIRPSQRGRGLGRQLFDWTLERARQKGLDSVLLVIPADDPASQKLAINAGAQLDSTGVNGQGKPVKRYRLELTPSNEN